MRSVSAKRAKVNRQRRKLGERLHDERGPWCELRTPVCTGLAEQMHEYVGRAQGGSLVDERGIALTCSACNTWVEDNPWEARERGLKCSRWDATVGVGGLVPSFSWRQRNGEGSMNGVDPRANGGRLCVECRNGRHGQCDSVDAFANHDYCGPRPICACFDVDPEGHDGARFDLLWSRHGGGDA